MLINFSTFPSELKEKIYSYCPTCDLLNIACCSKECYQIVMPLIWSVVKVQWKSLEDDSMLKKKSKYLKLTNALSLYEYYVDPYILKEDVRIVSYEHIIKNCDPSRLHSLKIDGYIVHNGLELASRNLPEVKKLSMRCVDLSCVVDWDYLFKFNQLTTLSICACNISDDELKNITGLNNLTELILVQCYQLTKVGLQHASNLVNLKKLICSNENIAVDDIVISRKLIYFKCMYRRYIPSEDYIHTISKLVNLVELNLSGTQVNDTFFAYVSNTLKNIHTLNVSKCHNLTGTGFLHISKLLSLNNLDISFCRWITNSGLRHISKLILLNCLNVSSCKNITNDGFLCLCNIKNLRHVNVRLCRNITQEGILKFKSCYPSPVVILSK